MAQEDLLSGDWKQLRAHVKERWHTLSDDDLALIAGSRTMLMNILCEKYAYPEQQAQKEIDEFLKQVTAPTHA